MKFSQRIGEKPIKTELQINSMDDDLRVDFEDAKYMLVSCSAFINYLVMKATKSGIKF